MEWIINENILDYEFALNKMEKMVNDIINGNKKETVWLLEHNDIYTAGTSTKNEHLENIAGAPVFKTNRGGQLTYHGPGQRIIYPMINLKRFSFEVRKYVNFLEQIVINTLQDFNIHTHRWNQAIGVWAYKSNTDNSNQKVSERYKIASIGIRVRKKISFHGISVNINPNLDYFHSITPCGIENSKATSTYDLGFNLNYIDFDKALKYNFYNLLKNN